MSVSPRIDNSLIGAAGVHYIASELSFRGLIALPTIRNTAGVDIIVSNREGTWHANLQVKTSKHKISFWPVSTKFEDWSGENNYYVFVRHLKRESRFEAFLVLSTEANEAIRRRKEEDEERGLAKWAPSFYLPKGENEILRLKKLWEVFGLEAV